MTDNITINDTNFTNNISVNNSSVPDGFINISNPTELASKLHSMLGDAEAHTIETLTAWGFEPTHILFLSLLAIGVVVLMYYVFVLFQSKSSGVFKIVFYILALVLILMLLGVI
jgi:hypothetical protein